MFRKPIRKPILWFAVFFLSSGALRAAPEEYVYYNLRLNQLRIVSGELPAPPFDKETKEARAAKRYSNVSWMLPYAIGEHNEEIYTSHEAGSSWMGSRVYEQNLAATTLAIRALKGSKVSGRLFVPKPDWSGMTHVDFALPEPSDDALSRTSPGGQKWARHQFFSEKEKYYQDQNRDGPLPGAAWFRHRLNEAIQEKREASSRPTRPLPNTRRPSPRNQQSDLQRGYALFSGGRAISENIQLDRELRVLNPTERDIPIDTLSGITVAEYDWKALVAGRDPKRDALAGAIPADQHALFFPSFRAMSRVLDEAKANGTPVLRLFDKRSEDARTNERYERQLCLSRDVLSRVLGPKLIRSVAFTGSDPYLRTGSDVAILFEAIDPPALKAALAMRQAAATTTAPEAKRVSGKVSGIAYSGLVSPDRSVCSYLASINSTVLVTNSLEQLRRIANAAQGQTPALLSLDEYTFFRDRYPLGDANEEALLILTDATIRRWCGPRWRIGASRRTRAAAVLAELQARHLKALAKGDAKLGPLQIDNPIPGLGDLRLTPSGVTSSNYGNLEFLTPIAELSIEKITKEESQAYEWYRQSYQRQWRQFFDPIAVRLTAQPDRLGLDVTVRPLIAASDYRDLIEVTGDTPLGPQAGDPHPEAALHYVMALDKDSEPIRKISSFASQMAPSLKANALGWLGDWIAVYADRDPFWDELEKQINAGQDLDDAFLASNISRLPVALHVDVGNSFKLVGFLVALRGFIEQTAPGMTLWETLDHNGRPYVKISPTGETKREMEEEGVRDFAVYYAAGPGGFTLTLSEKMLHRSLDRSAARSSASTTTTLVSKTTKAPEPLEAWLGQSMALHIGAKALEIIKTLSTKSMHQTMQHRSWGNLVILNEWRRRLGQTDPVTFHERHWQTRLVCPGGGRYVWNEEFQTMESTVYGHPGQPRSFDSLPSPFPPITAANMGLTFEEDGLRARGEIERSVE